MSLSPISKCSFSLQLLDEKSYELGILFKNGIETISKKTFVFTQHTKPKEGIITDVFTKNGTCQKNFIKKLFKASDLQEAEKASTQLKNSELSGPVVAVVDLKDTHNGYLPCKQCDKKIADYEDIVCDFIKSENATNSNVLKKIHDCFKSSLSLDFVICEGSLKSDLIKFGGFSEKEITYFNSKIGSESFCQCAEFFMNGFKLGQSAASTTKVSYLAEKYIKPVSDKYPVFQPHTKSTVFYPLYYKDLYSNDGEFSQILQSIFSVTGGFFSSTDITVINVEKKS